MKLDNLNESSFIQSIKQNISYAKKEVITGIGDDCAVLSQNGKASYLLLTCDIQIADIHFLPNIAKPAQIGHKAIAVNISDIAAMGGMPTYCLVSLILPKNIKKTYLEKLYEGIKAECNMYNIQIIGGNISQGKQIAVDVFMLGEVNPHMLLLRSGARPGDKVLVTGTLGEAAAGLAVLKNKNIVLSKSEREQILTRQLTPTPHTKESIIIAHSKQATAMIDISDGLATDISHICKQSKVGVIIHEEYLPISTTTKKVTKQLHIKDVTLALEGGEDYELLFTVPPNNVDEIITTVKQKTDTQVTVIGEILSKNEGLWLQSKNGLREKISPSGWDHFTR